jgi:hypothetical protein
MAKSGQDGGEMVAAGADFCVRLTCMKCRQTLETPVGTLLQFATCACANRARIAAENPTNESVLLSAVDPSLATVLLTSRLAPNLAPITMPLARWNSLQALFKKRGTLTPLA